MYKMNLVKAVRKGFTLIELLVVVAIIALLLAILVPSLVEARERARELICRTNLRACAQGALVYAAAHDGQFPGYINQTDEEAVRDGNLPNLGKDCPSKWASLRSAWEMVIIGGTNDCILAKLEAPIGRYDMDQPRKLAEYVPEEAFRCPSDHGITLMPEGMKNTTTSYDYWPSNYEFWGSSYMYNGGWMFSSHMYWALHGKRTHEASHPLTYIFADETFWYAFPYWVWLPSGPHGSHALWHDPPEDHPGAEPAWPSEWVMYYAPKCNVAFVDGHVEFLQLGPYGIGDFRVNTSNYVVVPDHPDRDYVK